MKNNRIQVGRVVETWVYPVKSMQGVPLPEITLKSLCVSGDRRRAFVLRSSKREFPWLTAREYPRLLLYAPYFVAPSHPETSEIRVKTPGGDDLAVDSEKLLIELAHGSNRDIYRLRLSRGAYDGMPVSIMTCGSTRALSQEVGLAIDPRRFRQNVLIETPDEVGYEENDWVNGLLTFGDRDDSARVGIVKADSRCMMINLDPDTAKQTPAVLRTVVTKHSRTMGVYGSPTRREGKIRVGDSVYFTALD